ncbi:extracellular solute-binding protein [Jiangella aurantiaca]|uniref:Extracellular solute-binding protein n=1 Tax=Jiangella aurantiaca TaxID=2530373 RepID=A0A4R5AIM1_9ACTN|nr:extracellular solute-binding protein [Jiangella aurantiaca]TDD71219.1 extracellular solute-binding protein [Jiangella aurantiaca]
MKRIVPLATMATAAALVLTGCGGAADEAGGGDDTTITFAHWGNTQEADTLKAMVAAFEEEHPDVDVELNWIQSDYEQKLQVSIAGGQAPTVSQISNTSLAGFANAYQEVDVDPSAYYSENIPNSMMIDGSYWAVPFVVKTKVMAVNGNVFDAAGVPLPPSDTPMTTDQFAQVAQQLTSGEPPEKVYGSARLWYDGWLIAEGGSFYDQTGTQCMLDSDVAIETARFVIDAQAPDGYAPTQIDAEGQDMFDWLSIGRLAMQPDFGPWDIAKLVAVTDSKLAIVPVPGNGEPMEINGLGISKDATPEEAEAARTFAEFMSTSQAAQDLLTTTESSLGVPVVEASIETFKAAAPELDLQAFVDAVDQSQIQPSVAKDAQIRSDFSNALYSRTALGSGTEDPADVFPELDEQCQSTLDSQ